MPIPVGYRSWATVMPICAESRPHRRVEHGRRNQHQLATGGHEGEVRPGPQQYVNHHQPVRAEPVGEYTHDRNEHEHPDRLGRDHHTTQPIWGAELQFHVDR